MRASFIERAIGRWLEGYSVIPMPTPGRYYEDFDHRPYETQQPSLRELYEWSKKYPKAGVGIVVQYSPDREKTLEAIRAMGDLDEILDIPVFILQMLKDKIGGKK